MTVKQYRELNKLVDRIYEEADRLGIGNPDLAAKAGLSYKTVSNLDFRRTMYPRTQTVMFLARTVGLTFVLEKSRVRLAA